MKKKIKIVEENGYRWRKEIVIRKEYRSITSVKIAKLRRQNDSDSPEVFRP